MRSWRSWLALALAAPWVSCVHLRHEAPPSGPAPQVPIDRLVREIPEAFASGTRVHLVTDRPLYRPGEVVWAQAFLAAPRLAPAVDPLGPAGVRYDLLDPQGRTAATLLAPDDAGVAHTALALPEDGPGGVWTVRATALDGTVRERLVVVVPFEAPPLLGDVQFARDGYGPGEEVRAEGELRRPTGEPLADHPVEAVLLADGEEHRRLPLRTDARGGVQAVFSLPSPLPQTAILALLDGEGGSVARPVPIAAGAPALGAFPEGGDLVAGLPSRVYLEATDAHGEPVDAVGRVLDEQDREVAHFEARRGRARLSLTPEPGRRYRAVVDRPAPAEVPLPEALAEGCVLSTRDDTDGQWDAIRAQVRCSEPREVVLLATQEGETIDVAKISVPQDGEATVDLATADEGLARAQGVARITLLSADLVPLAERLVYRNRGRDLRIRLEPSVDEALPGQRVTIEVRTLDPDGRPVPAVLALAVADDAWISAADEDLRDVRSALLLEPAVGEVDDPARFLERSDPESAADLDRLLGCRGWRRFRRVPIAAEPPASSPEPPLPERGEPPPQEILWQLPGRNADCFVIVMDDVPSGRLPVPGGGDQAIVPGRLPQGAAVGAVIANTSANRPPPRPEIDQIATYAPIRACFEREAVRTPDIGGVFEVAVRFGGDGRVQSARASGLEYRHGGVEACIERAVAGLKRRGGGDVLEGYASYGDGRPAGPSLPFTVVREFPLPPARSTSAAGSDLRPTVLWSPALRTDAQGRASVTFVTSDATTGFRIVAEGVGGGSAGRSERVLPSRRPLSVSVRVPPALVRGDRVEIPVTLDNATDAPLEVSLALAAERADLGAPDAQVVTVGARERRTVYAPLAAIRPGELTLRATATAGALSDTVERTIPIRLPGFPRTVGATRVLGSDASLVHLDATGALPGTVEAAVELAPGAAAAFAGIESMLAEPHGCFEQTSAASYPNALVLSVLDRLRADAPAIARAHELVERGLARIATFESPHGGFEGFGRDPGQLSMTAYGLLQLVRTRQVHPIDEALLGRTARWLLDQRDGRGGFHHPQDTTLADLYATWALVEAGYAHRLDAEIARARDLAATEDPYLLALAALILSSRPETRPDAAAAAARLAARQAPDGSFPGAATTLTHSYGQDKLVEATALASRALAATGRGEAAAAVRWLMGARRPDGRWGATQATIQALEAILLAHEPPEEGEVLVKLDGDAQGSLPVPAGLVPAILPLPLRPAAATVAVRGPEGTPVTVRASFRTLRPPDALDAPLRIRTRLAPGGHRAGDIVRLDAEITEVSGQGRTSPVARIGIPAGLSVRPEEIRDLVERGALASLEVTGGSVVAYWDEIGPGEVRTLALDLRAELPGTTTGEASSAWPYYEDAARSWTDPLTVRVER